MADVPNLPDEQKGAHVVGLLQHAIADVLSATDCAREWDRAARARGLGSFATTGELEHLRLMIEELRGIRGTLLDDLERSLPEPPAS